MREADISMTINLLQTPEYKKLMQNHIYETIRYLFDKNQEFDVACEIQYITFSPELPETIFNTFDDTVLFIISGYTFESASITEDYFSFEAGFGEENFGSKVSIPLLSIKQVRIGEYPIVFNLAKYEESQKKQTSTQSSMEALLKNPENKKLLRKKKS